MSQIVCGDVLEVLHSLESDSFDIGVTSPPYNKGGAGKNKGWLVNSIQYESNSDKMPEDQYQNSQISVLDELYRVIKPGGSFFYNHKVRWERGVMIHPMDWLRKTKWDVRQEIIWDRKIAAQIRGYRFWQTDERIYWLYKPVGDNHIGEEMNSKHALLTEIWNIRPENKIDHPAPFPIAIPVRCLYSVLDDSKGKRVIDPYMGSGTTAVACKFLGHDYFGIDCSQVYIEMANKRAENYLSEQKAFDEEIAQHYVKESFKERKAAGKWEGKKKAYETEPKDELCFHGGPELPVLDDWTAPMFFLPPDGLTKPDDCDKLICRGQE